MPSAPAAGVCGRTALQALYGTAAESKKRQLMRRSRTWLFGILLLCLGLNPVHAAGQGPEQAESASILVPAPHFDFGERSEADIVSHEYTVKNRGKSVLRITDVRTDCGCTTARFDQAIPPGGEGKITLKLDVKNFQGHVKKNAVVSSNDPQNPRVVLSLQGAIKPLIEVRPGKMVYFQGMADQLSEKTVDILTTQHPFHVRKTEDDLGAKAAYRFETVEDGLHYRLRIANRLRQGNYRGTITLFTDLAEKPEVTVWVNGFVEGEIGIRPNVLVVGRVAPEQPLLSGKVLVVSNRGRPFRITKCVHDERIIRVVPSPLPDGTGFSLEISPEMENIPPGGRLQTNIKIVTDLAPEEECEVQVQAINLTEMPK